MVDAGRIPLGLYVHLPWCERKCPYCDFNSHAGDVADVELPYVEAVLRDLGGEAAAVAGRRVETVYIGGGTPSLFAPAAIGRLLEGIAAIVDLAADAEISMEANPGSAEARRFAGYRAAGVNRLSIGVQSLDDRCLGALGRIHSAAEARAAVRAARGAGFGRVNVDLMYGLPGQDPAGAVADVEAALALEPEQISWYQLTLEPNTAFHHRPPSLPGEQGLATMAAAGAGVLEAAGLVQYEVSAWAPPGGECRHNLIYWGYGDYLGVGAGAHGKLTRTSPFVVERSARRRHPRDYMAAAAAAGFVSRRWRPDAGERVLEFMMNAMRLARGASLRAFEARTGLPRAALEPGLGRAGALGLVRLQDGRILPTPRGRRYLNDLLLEFLPPGQSSNSV